MRAPVRVFYGNYWARGKVREGHVARGEAECYMSFKNFPEPNNNISVEYERIRRINWFVVSRIINYPW